MARPSGLPKTGGRKKGTANRRTGELADQLHALGLDVPSEIMKTLPHLDHDSQAKVLLELMSFLYPKRKAIEVASEPKSSQKIMIEFVKAKNGKPAEEDDEATPASAAGTP